MPNQFSTTTAPNRNSFSAKCRVLRVIVAVAAIMLATSTSQAAVWYVKAGAATGGNGSNWSSAFRYLILATNAAQPGDQIWVAAGTYNPLDGNTDPNVTAFPRIAKFNLKAGVALYGGFLGTETSIGQRPVWDANGTGSPTILTADLNGNDIEADFPHGASYQDNAYRVLHVPPPTSGPLASDLTIIDGFTIKGGRANGADGVGFNKGGGIRIENGIVEIRRCLLQMNYATTGAGLWSNRDVLFDKSRFSGNKAGVDGAGAYVIAAVEASRCRFDHNDAGSSGGGLFRQGAAIISFCDFESNSAQGHGGASYNVTTASYLNCRMTNNFAGGLGGGAHMVSPGDLYLVNCLLTLNTSNSSGGAVYTDGAIIQNCTIADNTSNATNGCGGAYLASGGNTVTNTVLWGNRHSNGTTLVQSFSSQLQGSATTSYSCIFGGGPGNGTGVIGADPVFVGGGDYHVQIGSPCNDAGTNDVAANPNDPLYSSVDLDQNIRWGNDPLITPDPGDATPPLPSDCGGLGNPCFVIDMGCYEFNSELAPFEIVYVNATVPPGSLRNGSSWANAMPSLKTAISIAAGSPEIREIWVARGTYMPDGGYIPLGGTRVAGTGARSDAFILTSDVSILGGFSGSEFLSEQRDAQVNLTKLSGDLLANDTSNFGNYGDNSYHVLVGSGTGTTAVLNGFTVSGGNADGAGGASNGGGLLSGGQTIQNCIFRDNRANAGGAIYVAGTAPQLIDCRFIGNRSGLAGAGGGAIWSDSGNAAITNCVFDANSSVAGVGGGIFSGGGALYNLNSTTIVFNCLFTANTADTTAGAIKNNGGTPWISNCEFRGNSSVGNGGAISNHNGSVPKLRKCIFTENTATASGGAVANLANSAPVIASCEFVSNSASAAAGAMMSTGSSNVTLVNCRLAGNAAGSYGGGVWGNSLSSYSITNCTFGKHTAGVSGGCVWVEATGGAASAVLKNCILWNTNLTFSLPQVGIDSGGGSVTVSFSDILGGYTGTSNIDADPLFLDSDGEDNIEGNLDDNLRLSGNSPALHTGLISHLPQDALDLDGDGDSSELLPVDLDGNARVSGPSVDMGSYERFADCQPNNIDDLFEIAQGTSQDCNNNSIPDECEIGLIGLVTDAISIDSAPNTRDDTLSDLASNGAGVWMVVWSAWDAPGSDNDVWYSISIDDGATWSAIEALSENHTTDDVGDFWPSIANDGGSTWIVAWTLRSPDGSDHDIVFRRSTDDGATWSPTQTIHPYFDPEVGYDDLPEIACDGNGNWVLVFQSHNSALTGGDPDIVVSRSSDNGATWSLPQLLVPSMASDSLHHSRPRLATDGAGIWVVVMTRYVSPAEDTDILYSVSQDNGATWTEPAFLNPFFATVHGNEADDHFAYVESDGANNWVAIFQSGENFNGIQNPTNGDQEVLAARITTANLISNQPWDISVVNTHAWTDCNPGVFVCRNDSQPHIGSDRAGNWLAAWESHYPPGDPAGDDRDIFVAQSRDSGATWSTPRVVNSYAYTPGEMDLWPKIATDRTGLWMVSWHTDEAALGGVPGSRFEIALARFRMTDDCNNNGILDDCEIADSDANVNLLLDVCEDDCNNNGTIDLFETDTDNDTRIDACDNCPFVPNTSQTDTDGDGVGDACDICPVGNDAFDADADAIPDACDKCPGNQLAVHAVPTDCNGDGDTTDAGEEVGGQCDRDLDGVGDECDNCPDFYNPAQLPDEPCQSPYGLGSRLNPPASLVGVSLANSYAQITTNTEWMNPGFNPGAIPENQWVAAPLAVFQHPSDFGFYAIDAGLIRLTWRNAAGSILGSSFFVIQNIAADNDWTVGVRYFLDYNEGQFDKNADVVISTSLYATVLYNSQIQQYRVNPLTNPPQYYPFPDFRVDGDRALAEQYCPNGKVCILYEDGPGGDFVGFEVVNISRYGPGQLQTVPVGRRLLLPSGATDCRAVLISNFEAFGTRAAWQKGVEDAVVYPLRPESLPSNFVVAWYKESVFPNGAIQPTRNCWPQAISRYRAEWPVDPQVHVVDSNPVEVPLGSQINLHVGAGQRYCQAEVMYQQGFGPLEDPPYSQIINGLFDAIKPGFSVIRFDIDPPGAGLCGDDVTFEVVMSRDHSDADAVCASGPIAGNTCADDASCFAILNPATGVCRTNVFAGQFVWDIGDQITDPEHDNACEDFPHGFLYEGQPYNPAIYGATGQIFPVNSYDVHGTLEVWWYVASRGTDDGNTQNGNYAPGIFWPHKTALYQPEWPVTPYKIVVARRVGGEITEGTPRVYDTHASLYHTGGFSATLGVLDSDQETIPGWNPNDEHAVILPVAGGYRVFAARDDFPWTTLTNYSGHPYVLVQFPTAGDGANPTAWGMDVFQVLAEDVGVDNDLDYTDLVNQADPTETVPLVAGMPLSPVLFPINYGAPECFVPNLIPPDPLTYSVGDAVWLDRKGGAWVIEAEHDGFVQNPLPDPEGNSALGTPSVSDVYLWENWGPDGGCQPWLSFRSGLSTVPEPIRFRPQWPLVPPACAFPNDALCARPLKIGQSVDQSGQCGTIQVLHDSVGQRIIDPTRWVGVTVGDQVAMGNIALNDFQNLPPHLYAGEIGGGGEFPDRIRWNFNASGKLEFRGIMSDADQYYLDQISNNVSYLSAIAALYAASRSQLMAPEEDAAAKVVTVGDAAAIPGWITVAFQNDQAFVDAGLPVSVEVWRVDCPPFTGSIRVIQPECLFSEKLAMQFSGDLGGDPDQVTFHWQYSLDYDPAQPELAQWDDYFPSNSLPPTMQAGTGLREVLIEGASLFTLQDSWWRVRYRGYAGCPGDGNPLPQGVAWPNFIANDGTEPSLFTEPQLAEGWVKRVVRQLTPFDQRFSDFHETPVNTIVDMIAQAGIRYEQNVALNCDPNNLDAIGLIEAYSTVMNRAKSFSAAASVDGVNQAIELVASKVSDLYMLLGNEAYADAMDPTLGVFAGGGEAPAGYNPLAAFSFQDQLPSLLEEELALLRGVSDTRAPDKNADNQTIATVYNRIPWNFTSGVGQVAYANNYQLTNVTQALQTYPQGHGDAWGHYLQATKLFYKLLGDSTFTWITESESVLVAGQPVEVGFMYERKFAEAAAAKARTGAAITALTFREQYTGNAADQNGYPDSDSTRAWGLAEWGRRSGQGAYFDWVMANAILDDQGDGMICQETGTPCGEGTTGCNGNDPCIPDLNYENSIRKVDRTTVKDIGEIASAYSEIQSTLDKADAGLNPLGLASNVVPFGLNPTAIQQGQTHFDQIYQRAVSALSNAVTAFNYANENTRRLRNLQDRVDTFDDLVEERELDYEARLIEIFGKPYPEDIGGTGAYPVGYNGPDLYHYDYADPSELIGTQGSGNTTTFTITFQEQTVDPVSGVITVSPRTVNFVVSTDGLGLVKPEGWTERTEPGEIQFSRSELLQGIGRYQQSVDRYESLIDQIEIQADLLESLYELNRNVLQVMREGQALQQSLNQQILVSRLLQARFRTIGANALRIANAIAEGLPTSLIGGLANGGDFTGPIRASVRRAASFIEFAFNQTADALSVVEQQRQFDKEWASAEQQIQITGYQGDYQVEQQVAALRNLVRQLPSSRLEIYTLGESVNQATGRYHAAIGRGLRLLDQRAAYRRRTADEVSEFRYQDMAYRVFRNESLQKYRAQFDLAAEYVYLAARAYDYETNLLGTHALAGRQYLTNIVKQRTLGVMAQSGPQIGSGLAGTLAEMFINFDLVLRPQLGFNSAAELNRTFSLRWELFRKPNTNAFNSDWQQVLEDARVSDINDFVEVPEYRMFCKPLNADPDLPAVANPGIVLRFSTKIFSGLNFFGHASQADEVYPSSYDTIKLHSIGIRFENYPLGTLNNQAEVYLVPAGMDVLREPTNGEIRNWQLLDQTLPVPFPLGEQSLAAADWMPWDSLSGGSRAMVKRRLIPQVTGLPAQGHEDDEDLRYHLTGRSVWNTQWVLIIPASELRGAPHPNGDPLDLFIYGPTGQAPGVGVKDIKLIFNSYGYSGTGLTEPEDPDALDDDPEPADAGE